jgi:predicted nucleotidyltransferase
MNTQYRTPTWQASTISALTDLLHTDPGVIALAVFGSAMQPGAHDTWSDVDLLVVVGDDEMPRFYPATAWLEPLGRIFAREQSGSDFASTTRVCLEDLRRLDLVIATESSIRQVDTWPRVAFAGGVRVLFSRSPEIAACLSGPFESVAYSPPSQGQFDAMVDGFWFRAMVAIYKVVRSDLVIALHLALGLRQDGCVLAMMLRDRATGTNQHKTGGVANDIVATFADTDQPPTPSGILNLIEASGLIFDRLAQRWSKTYLPQMAVLQVAIEWARDRVAQQGDA